MLKSRGIVGAQTYGTADLGLQSPTKRRMPAATGAGGMVIDEDIIVEIVRPGTGETGRRRRGRPRSW